MSSLKKFGKKLWKGNSRSRSSQSPSHAANASNSSVAGASIPASSAPAGDPRDQLPETRTQTASRSAPWIERILFILRTTKEAAEAGGDLAAPLKAACGVTISILEAFQATSENREAWRALIETIKEHNSSFESGRQLGGIAADSDSPLAKALEDYQGLILEVLQQVFEETPNTIATEEIEKVSTLAKICEFARRLGVSKWEASSIKGHQDRLNNCQRNIMSMLVTYIAIRTEERDENRLLETLRVKRLDKLTQPEGCMEGTREDILQEILQWSRDTTRPNILWVKGHPGCGKSAIARSAAERFEKAKDVDLATIFVFQRQQAALLNLASLWRTVAFRLAQKLPAVRSSLLTRLKVDEITLDTPNVDQLFQELIVDSLSEIKGIKPIVVVIDALDECGGAEGRLSKDRKALMRSLKRWRHFPSSMKLLVTSRAEEDVERTFKPGGTNRLVVEIPVGSNADLESQASKDIHLFLTQEFKEITARYPSLQAANWPESDIIKELTRRAMGLFIWAATVIRLVEEGEPVGALKRILKQQGSDGQDVLNGLDVLYAQVLSFVFKNPKEEDFKAFHAVAGAIIAAEAPLSQLALTQLLEIEQTVVERVCQGLQSVLLTENFLQFRHQSFVDFLLGPEVSPDFAIKPGREHATLALGCLQTMNKGLCFNICDIPSSYKANTDIPDIDSKIRKHISQSLSYASYYWGHHLSKAAFEDVDKEKAFRLIQMFQSQNFLFWLEVLSLTKGLIQGSAALSALKQWLHQYSNHQDSAHMISFTDDMLRFIGQSGGAISCSVPHIYLSALPLAPSQSMVLQQYKQHYPQTISIQSGGNVSWPTLRLVITASTGVVTFVAFSRDGSRIVSGSYDHTVRIWDAASGEPVGEPLRGHTHAVTSVAFSGDGSRIVSGSWDQTVRIWDAASGEPVGEPLRGHTHAVTSVAFSGDGSRIVSGSHDQTVRIWNAASGEPVGEPLRGHTDAVTSVAFSRDGSRIVSGSYDQTVRIWDAASGEPVGEPLRGHTHAVTSVAFSGDGSRIVSGSYDQTVRIWDAASGEPVGEPLHGHTNWVTSVAFSGDGSRIVSGSYDHTVRIWDAASGEPVGEPLRGHTHAVTSVAFSGDGSRIVSGSWDQTVRIWDAASGEPVGEPLRGHTDAVTSVAFSRDGSCIVSGSPDQTVRIWNAASGEPVGEPLRGHTNAVTSVAFSGDGSRIVSGSYDQTVRIWDAASGEPVGEPLHGHTNWVTSVAFSGDGSRIVSGSYDHTVRIWDAASGEPVGEPLRGHTNAVTSVAFSGDESRIVSGSYDHTVRIWDAASGEPVGEPLRGHTNAVTSVAFSGDGSRIVSGSYDQTVRIWDAASGEPVGQPLRGHTNAVTSVAFSGDGSRIVSGSYDRTVRIWDAESGEPVAEPLHGHIKPVTSVALSGGGLQVVSSLHDPTIQVLAQSLPTNFWYTLPNALSFASFPYVHSDGWIYGPNQELIVWIPPNMWAGFLFPNCKIIGGDFIRTAVNLCHFKHGLSWTQCRGASSS